MSITETYLVTGQLNSSASSDLTFAAQTSAAAIEQLKTSWISKIESAVLDNSATISIRDIWLTIGSHSTEHSVVAIVDLKFDEAGAKEQDADSQSKLQETFAEIGIYAHLHYLLPLDGNYSSDELHKIKIKIKIGMLEDEIENG